MPCSNFASRNLLVRGLQNTAEHCSKLEQFFIYYLYTIPSLKVKNDHRSKFSNLRNWKEEAWKNQGFKGIRTRDLRATGAMLYQLNYEVTHWERGQFIEFISPMWSEMCGFIAQLVEHRTGITEVTGSNPDEALIFFRLLLSNCLNWKINCYDHSSLPSTTAV